LLAGKGEGKKLLSNQQQVTAAWFQPRAWFCVPLEDYQDRYTGRAVLQVGSTLAVRGSRLAALSLSVSPIVSQFLTSMPEYNSVCHTVAAASG
jgi:hypothetical protein